MKTGLRPKEKWKLPVCESREEFNLFQNVLNLLCVTVSDGLCIIMELNSQIFYKIWVENSYVPVNMKCNRKYASVVVGLLFLLFLSAWYKQLETNTTYPGNY